MIHIYEVLMLYEYQKYMIVLFKFWIKQIDKKPGRQFIL